MLTVYRLEWDFENFQYFLPDDVKAVMKFKFDGNAIGDAWVPPPLYFANPHKPRPDIWHCSAFGSTCFAVSTKIPGELLTVLHDSCELLPFECNGEKFWICNVTLVLNALNERESSQVKGTAPNRDKTYVFYPQRFEFSLFKIPQTRYSEILCLEVSPGTENEFKYVVEMFGLTGVNFEPIWSGEEPEGFI